MEKFLEAYERFIQMKKLGDYRLCWIPSGKIYSVIEFFDEELPLIDKNKVEIILF